MISLHLLPSVCYTMIELALSDSTQKRGLDFMKALSRHSNRIKFESREDVSEFLDYLNDHSDKQRENVTYQYDPMNDTRAAPQIQARSQN